jgi:exosortase F-associated protein
MLLPKKKIMHKPIVRWLLLCLLALATFGLGLIRYDYVLNFIDPSLPFFLPRNTAEQIAYPLSLSELTNSLFHDPRWLSTCFYMTYPAIATCIAVYLIFQKKNYLQLTLLFYGTGIILLILLVLCSILMQEYTHGYALAQYFKKIYQEPYASLLLIGSFYWDRKNRDLKSEI